MKHLTTLLVILFAGFYSHGQNQQVKLNKMKGEILVLVNKYRVSQHLKPLKDNAIIAKEAEIHSKNMANGSVAFSHDGFDNRVDRIRNKVKDAYEFAENVAYGPKTAQKVVDNWLASPGHKKNIEGDFNLSGIGVAQNNSGRIYFTQIFAKK